MTVRFALISMAAVVLLKLYYLTIGVRPNMRKYVAQYRVVLGQWMDGWVALDGGVVSWKDG